ncbi:MYO18 [Lepeophtheirus salmonis]|uniref:MYO18 n=1 Tax=Lepeophtheirus salmonis TaxID=72036 RepID=A0A7R8CPY4_LEPSM|nr:MYO18 [Lepeophtheirus salmonis]CAF2852890.1 MYO18 [Lepeophtheirus salmonis]
MSAKSEEQLNSEKSFLEVERAWLVHKDGFSSASQLKSDQDLPEGKVRIQLDYNGDVLEVEEDDVEKANPPGYDKVEDLAQLRYLNESSVLNTLRQRYGNNLIHTYAGPSLISINPMSPLAIYSDKVIQMFKECKTEDMPPHIYSVAQLSYRSMLSTRKDQSIVFIGRSGSGKTTNVKHMLSYFTKTSGNKQVITTEKVNAIYVLLEAFGHSRTNLNSNASRFTELISLDFDASGGLISASIQAMMLEKTRVVRRPDGEPNFNIFYHLLMGSDSSTRKDLMLDNLNEPNLFVTQLQKPDDKSKVIWNKIQSAIKVLGISSHEAHSLWSVLAAIFHLGTASVTRGTMGKSLFARPQAGTSSTSIRSKSRDSSFRSSDLTNLPDGIDSLHGFVIGLYQEVFNTLIYMINRCISDPIANTFNSVYILDTPGFQNPASCGRIKGACFEELCHNYVQERLQLLLFHKRNISSQYEKYLQEQVEPDVGDLDDIGSPESMVSLLDKQPGTRSSQTDLSSTERRGLLWLLDEEALFPGASDETFVERLLLQYNQRGSDDELLKRGLGEKQFVLQHFQGTNPVLYNAEGWLSSSREDVALLKAAGNILTESNTKSISELYSSSRGPGSTSVSGSVAGLEGSISLRRASSIRRAFTTGGHAGIKRHSIALQTKISFRWPGLCDIVGRSASKGSNSSTSSSIGSGDSLSLEANNSNVLMNIPLVRSQVRGGQILDSVRLFKNGYPESIPYALFWRRFHVLGENANQGLTEPPRNVDHLKTAVSEIFSFLDLDSSAYRLGNSQIIITMAPGAAYLHGNTNNSNSTTDSRLHDETLELRSESPGYHTLSETGSSKSGSPILGSSNEKKGGLHTSESQLSYPNSNLPPPVPKKQKINSSSKGYHKSNVYAGSRSIPRPVAKKPLPPPLGKIQTLADSVTFHDSSSECNSLDSTATFIISGNNKISSLKNNNTSVLNVHAKRKTSFIPLPPKGNIANNSYGSCTSSKKRLSNSTEILNQRNRSQSFQRLPSSLNSSTKRNPQSPKKKSESSEGLLFPYESSRIPISCHTPPRRSSSLEAGLCSKKKNVSSSLSPQGNGSSLIPRMKKSVSRSHSNVSYSLPGVGPSLLKRSLSERYKSQSSNPPPPPTRKKPSEESKFQKKIKSTVSQIKKLTSTNTASPLAEGSKRKLTNPITSLIKFYECREDKKIGGKSSSIPRPKSPLKNEERDERDSSLSNISLGDLSQLGADRLSSWLINPLKDNDSLERCVSDLIKLASEDEIRRKSVHDIIHDIEKRKEIKKRGSTSSGSCGESESIGSTTKIVEPLAEGDMNHGLFTEVSYAGTFAASINRRELMASSKMNKKARKDQMLLEHKNNGKAALNQLRFIDNHEFESSPQRRECGVDNLGSSICAIDEEIGSLLEDLCSQSRNIILEDEKGIKEKDRQEDEVTSKRGTIHYRIKSQIFKHFVGAISRGKKIQKLKVQDIAIRCIQKNVRKFMGVRGWHWWRLLIKITPMLNVHRTEDQLKSKINELENIKIKLEKFEKDNKEYKIRNERLDAKVCIHHAIIHFVSIRCLFLFSPSPFCVSHIMDRGNFLNRVNGVITNPSVHSINSNSLSMPKFESSYSKTSLYNSDTRGFRSKSSSNSSISSSGYHSIERKPKVPPSVPEDREYGSVHINSSNNSLSTRHQPTSKLLTKSIKDFITRTDHSAQEWKSLGRASSVVPESSSSIKKQAAPIARASSVAPRPIPQNSNRDSIRSSRAASSTRFLSLEDECNWILSGREPLPSDGDDDSDTLDDISGDELSEMTADLAEEHSTATLATERLEVEQTERMKLAKERDDLSTTNKRLLGTNARMETELLYSRAVDLNGLPGFDDVDEDGEPSFYKQKYERAMKELELAKKRLQQQHEDDLEQLMAVKKQLEKKLYDAYEEVDEQRNIVAQWKRKTQKAQGESNDFKHLYEEQSSRNVLLEKKKQTEI